MKKTIHIIGPAGGGLNSLEEFLLPALQLKGYFFYAYRNVMSRVRGGSNRVTITYSTEPLRSFEEKADYLVLMGKERIEDALEHAKDHALFFVSSEETCDTHDVIRYPQEQLRELSSHPGAVGMAALGTLYALLGLGKSCIERVTKDTWNDETKASNRGLVDYGYAMVDAVTERPDNPVRGTIMGGNQAIAIGALSGGLEFYSAYPMAPSTGIISFLASVEEAEGIFTDQAEDEIAAVMSAIGAASAGAKAMTGTSGGGFALMTESIGLSAIAKIPLVIVNAQRPGPATGLPTHTAQGDLFQALGAAQGEFARVVLAPGDIEESLYAANTALDLAWKYQIPVIILSDEFLSDSSVILRHPDYRKLKNERYLAEKGSEYKRYAYDRISGDYKYPGYDESIILNDSHTHLEDGFYTERPDLTKKIQDQFIAVLDAIRAELDPPAYYGPPRPKTLLLGWGSSKGVLKDVVDAASGVGMLHFKHIYPLPDFDMSLLKSCRLINVEMNSFGQFGTYLRSKTGLTMDGSILRYDGLPLSTAYVLERLEKLL
ncbi:MAG TPA: hypothetical protein GX733_08400 [Tissierellia bacterium]|jgi:2-oxoglutarate ferredoxin oxidoreductase subunit alpha|nr:hypothetical protein [Tissierellia bacterium]